MKHALVTGASGFIGRHLCQLLQSRGVRVRALNRKPAEGAWDEAMACDLERETIPSKAMDGIDTVFHLAARVHQFDDGQGMESAYHQANVLATQNLLRAAERADVVRFVFFSSLSVMGEITESGECQDELHAAKPNSLYGSSKLKAEGLVKASSIPHVCILRPAMVYGADCKGNLPRMISAMTSGWFPPLPEVHNKRSMIHEDDLAQAAVLAATHNKAAGQTYIITDGCPYSTSQIYTWIREALGKPVPSWHVPISALRVFARVGDGIGKLSGRRFVFNSSVLNKLLGSAWYSNDKAVHELGFKAHYTLHDSMPEIINTSGFEGV